MKERKIPMRTCVITKEQLPKKELIRIVKTKDGEIIPDLTGKINGHGAYIKKDLDVLAQAKKSKALERKLECTISEEVYEKINEIIKEN